MRRPLGAIVERDQVGYTVACQGGTEQEIGQVRVRWQERAVQVRRHAQAKNAVFPGQRQQTFRRVDAVVAVSARNTTQRMHAWSKV